MGYIWFFYACSVCVGVICYQGLRYRKQTIGNLPFVHTEHGLRNYSIPIPMAEKAIIIFYHFTDLFIGGGLLYSYFMTIGEWQSGISLTILVAFAILRGAALYQDILSKKEDRKKKEIENDERRFELQQKKNKSH